MTRSETKARRRIKKYFKYVKAVDFVRPMMPITDVYVDGLREWYEGMLRRRR